MIPLLTSQTSEMTALAEAAPVETTLSDGSLFAGILEAYAGADVEVDGPALADAAVFNDDGKVIAEPQGDVAIETPPFGVVQSSDRKPVPDLGVVVAPRASEKAGAVPAEKAAITSPALPQVKRVADGKQAPTSETGVLPARASTAQTALESRMPMNTALKAPPEQVRAPVGERLLDPVKTKIGQSATPQTGNPQVAPGLSTAASAVVAPPVAAIQMPTPRPVPSEADKREDALVKQPRATPLQSAPAVPSVAPPAVAIAKTLQPLKAFQVDAGVKVSEAEFALPGTATERSAMTTVATAQGAASAGADVARQVATQIAVVVHSQPNKTTEITLNPEELGRVRLSMTAVDGAITLHMSSERPETQDLLRRHIDILAQEFRALGYGSISFSFDGDRQQPAEQGEDLPDDPATLEPQDDQKPLVQIEPQTSSGIDLRL